MKIRRSSLMLAVVACLLTSSWGPVLLKIRGYYMPELALAYLGFYLWRQQPEIFGRLLRCVVSLEGVVGLWWLTLIAALGAWKTGSMVGPYSEWRSSLILLYTFLYFYRFGHVEEETVTILKKMVVGSLVLDAMLIGVTLMWPTALGTALSTDYTDLGDARAFGFGRFAVPAITIVGAAYLCSRQRSAGWLYLTLAIGSASALGGHRLVLLAVALSALFVPICVGWAKVKLARSQVRFALVTVAVIVTAIWVFRGGVVQRYLEEAGAIRYRLVDRSASAIDSFSELFAGRGPGNFGDDAIRASYVYYLYHQWPTLLLPHGLGSREVEGRFENYAEVRRSFGVLEPGNTHDSALLYYSYHHGMIASGFLLAILIFMLGRRMLCARGWNERAEVALYAIGVMIVEMVHPSVPGISLCLVLGAVTGVALRPHRLRRKRDTGEIGRLVAAESTTS